MFTFVHTQVTCNVLLRRVPLYICLLSEQRRKILDWKRVGSFARIHVWKWYLHSMTAATQWHVCSTTMAWNGEDSTRSIYIFIIYWFQFHWTHRHCTVCFFQRAWRQSVRTSQRCAAKNLPNQRIALEWSLANDPKASSERDIETSKEACHHRPASRNWYKSKCPRCGPLLVAWGCRDSDKCLGQPPNLNRRCFSLKKETLEAMISWISFLTTWFLLWKTK